MAGYLLFVIFMTVFSETKGQDLPAPKLSVQPELITKTGSVTLNCQTPVPMDDCYFVFGQSTARSFPCHQTLNGTDLLSKVDKSSAAEVTVSCFYLNALSSPHSEKKVISIRDPEPPILTVHPSVITELDSVTFYCQPPSYVPVSWCFFYTLTELNWVKSACVQTVRGSALLTRNQSLPAEVQVKCYYTVQPEELNIPSPHSDKRSVSVKALAPPTLTLKPSVITELDSVTLHCQPPSYVSASLCYFYFVNALSGQPLSSTECVQTLRGSDLLMVNQRPPAEVHLQCYYIVKRESTVSPSPHSDRSAVSVQSSKPEISVQHDPDQFDIVCSLPGSAKTDSPCYLYFGESTQPFLTTNITSKRTTKDRTICRFTVSVEDLQRNLGAFNTTDISCDYSLESGHNSLSPRSDKYNMSDVAKITAVTTMTPTSFDSVTATSPRHVTRSETEKTHSPDSNSNSLVTFSTIVTRPKSDLTSDTHRPVTSSTSAAEAQSDSDINRLVTSPTPLVTMTKTHLTSVQPIHKETAQQPESGNSSSTKTFVLKLVILLCVCGVIVGCVLLVLGFFCTKQTNGKVNSQDPNSGGLPLTGEYSLVASVPAAGSGDQPVSPVRLYP